VGNPDIFIGRGQAPPTGNLRDRPDIFADLEAVRVEGGHPAGIIATILQPGEAFYQERRDLLLADNDNDTAYRCLL